MLHSIRVPAESVVLLENGQEALQHLTTMAQTLRPPPLASHRQYDGAPAADIVTASPWQPMLVLMDILMPGMTGVEVMQALPSSYRSTGMCTFVAMTGSVDRASLQLYTDVGFSGVLPKPFSAADLHAVIRRAAAMMLPVPVVAVY